MPSTKKQIIIAVILAVLGIVTVLLLMRVFQGSPANELVFLRENEEYSQNVYQMDDCSIELKNGDQLDLNLIVYLKEKNEFQFGFSIPKVEELENEEPFSIEIVDVSTGKMISDKPFFVREIRDDRYYYRAIFLNAKIDVEASPDLVLKITDLEGLELYSEVFITKDTLFKEKSLEELPVADDKISIQDQSDSAAA